MSLRALGYVLCVWLLLSTAIASTPTEKERARYDTESAAIFLPVEIPHTLLWDKCGGVNGYYSHPFNLILLCEENLDRGLGVARFIYLHELGHAYTFSREFNFSRWGGNYEAAADEFGAVSAVAQGHPEDVLAMALYFEARSKNVKWDPRDPHPPMLVRALTLKRLYYGSLMPWGPLGSHWREALKHWTTEFRKWNN